MQRYFVFLLAILFLGGCAHGPVYTAKNEGDAIKKDYQDRRLQDLSRQNQNLLKEIYTRFTSAKVDFYREGLGFADFVNQRNVRTYYLMIKVRPQEIMYKGEKNTKPEDRFSQVLQQYAPKYLKYVHKSDLEIGSVEGLAFGVYWPVRDVCDTYGGFIEYIEFYTPKQFVNEYLDGKITFQEMLLDTEVVRSLNKGQPMSVKPVYK